MKNVYVRAVVRTRAGMQRNEMKVQTCQVESDRCLATAGLVRTSPTSCGGSHHARESKIEEEGRRNMTTKNNKLVRVA